MTDSKIEGPRLAQSNEFDDVLALVDRCFTRERGTLQATFPHCYDREHPERHAVIRVDGEIVSHIAAIPDTLVVGDGEIECWGISGVGTDPRYRGNGYMTSLLEFWIERMDAAEIPLSKLWGDRQRYGSFGWETAGRECAFQITQRSFPDPPDRDSHVVHYAGTDDHLERIAAIYDTGRYRLKRESRDHRRLLGQRGLETIIYTEPGEASYLAFTTDGRAVTVTEVGGTDRGVLGLLAYLRSAYYVDTINCSVHPNDPLAEVLATISADWDVKTHKKIAVRDLPTVLEAFTSQMARRWRSTPVTCDDGTLTLAIEGDDAAARLRWTGSDVTVDRTVASEHADYTLERREATRMLFGFPDRAVGRTALEPFLEVALPLDFYVWNTECV